MAEETEGILSKGLEVEAISITMVRWVTTITWEAISQLSFHRTDSRWRVVETVVDLVTAVALVGSIGVVMGELTGDSAPGSKANR